MYAGKAGGRYRGVLGCFEGVEGVSFKKELEDDWSGRTGGTTGGAGGTGGRRKEGGEGGREGERSSMCGGIDSVTAVRRSRFVASKKLQGDLRER